MLCTVNAEATERHFLLPHESRCRPCGRFHILKPFTGIFPFSSIYKPLHNIHLNWLNVKNHKHPNREIYINHHHQYVSQNIKPRKIKEASPDLMSCIFNCLLDSPQGSTLTQLGHFSTNGRTCAASGRIREEGWETSGKIILMNTALPLIQKAGSLLRLRGVFVRVCTRELPLLTKNCTAWDD